MRKVFAAVTFAAILPLSLAAAGNDLDNAISRYEAAAYEDALGILQDLSPSTTAERVQVEQYRALCHMALGHSEDAERAVRALVDADPLYVPPASIASPKVLTAMADIRRQQIPVVARRLLDSGRMAFNDKKAAVAQDQFRLLLKVLEDPAMTDRPETADYRSLAQGFVALTAAPPPAESSPANAAPSGATVPAPPAASPASPTQAPVRAFTPAVPLQETLPPWNPPNPAVGRNQYTGALKVRIDAEGRVTRATVETPSHPAYDAALVRAARNWRYKPAMQDGVSTESERVVAVRLRPVS